MVAHRHPSELNPLQQFRQASSIFKTTSRARNDGWYVSPLELDFQLHLRIDGLTLETRIFLKANGAWTPGPAIDEELIREPGEALVPIADRLIKLARTADSSAVGIVVHVADEFAITELDPEFDNPGALPELREALLVEPKSVLDDSTLSEDEHSWRLLPYPAAGNGAIATAVTLGRRIEPLLEALRAHGRKRDFPIVTLTLSAPLLALQALPELIRPSSGKPFLAVLHYPRFTILSFFNEHGDLKLLRTLHHHRNQRRPSNLRHAASTTAMALELSEFEIHLVDLDDEGDDLLRGELETAFPDSPLHVVDRRKSKLAEGERKNIPLEFAMATGIDRAPDGELGASHTFTTLREDGWATQDFLPTPPATAEQFPSRLEMKMLLGARFLRLGLAAALIGMLAWSGLSVFGMLRSEEWSFDQNQAASANAQLQALTLEKRRLEHWDNLLADRSKAWTSLELLARLFPGSEVQVEKFSHRAEPERAAAAAQSTRAAFVKSWTIQGLASEEARPMLEGFNSRDGIASVFRSVHEATGNEAFDVAGDTRSLLATAKLDRNPRYARGTSEGKDAFPYRFTLSITQRFESTDPLALDTAQTP